MNFKGSNVSHVGGSAVPSFSSVFCHPTPLNLPLKMRKLSCGKAQICYAGGPRFLNNFFWYFRYTLIQPQYTADSRLFVQNGVDIPILFQQAAPARHLLTLWRTVTTCVPVLRPNSEDGTIKQVFWLVGPIWNKGISPQISQYGQGRKVCRLKAGWLNATSARR